MKRITLIMVTGIIVIAAIVAGVSFYNRTHWQTKAEKLYKIGLGFLDKGNFQEAERYLKESLSSMPGQYIDAALGVKNVLAQTYAKQKEYDKAAALLEDILSHPNPFSGGMQDVMLNLGHVYYQSGKYDSAIELFKKLLEPQMVISAPALTMKNQTIATYSIPEEKTRTLAAYGMGISLFALGKYKEATPFLEQAKEGFQKLNDKEMAIEVDSALSRIPADATK